MHRLAIPPTQGIARRSSWLPQKLRQSIFAAGFPFDEEPKLLNTR
jgi:hypothetical protein